MSQVARALGFSETIVRKMIREGDLKAVQCRGFLAVTDDALREFVSTLPEVR